MIRYIPKRFIAVAFSLVAGSALAATINTGRFVVVFKGAGIDRDSARQIIEAAGGTVQADLSEKIGVVVATSTHAEFLTRVRGSLQVEEAGSDFSWDQFGSPESTNGFQMGESDAPAPSGLGGPEAHADPFEPLQWSMRQIRAPRAHSVQAGARQVDVGVLDTGIDGKHIDFDDDGFPGGTTNVDCARGRNSVPAGPGVGTADPCVDNHFHGTHVAGLIGAQANGRGIVGVAPNVTLVPIKVCDAFGFCYASAVVDGIVYAGDIRLDVINMSFSVDDGTFGASTPFKCMDDPMQRAFRRSVERAIQYARMRGATPVASLGNRGTNLSNSNLRNGSCEAVPAETAGVIGTVALGPASEKASYSNWGTTATDVAAPGGDGAPDCLRGVISTVPRNGWACRDGTSMAAPHVSGVAALIISQFGKRYADGDVDMSPLQVSQYLEGTAIDIGKKGYDACFGQGRVDALRSVQHDTTLSYEAIWTTCE